MAQRNGMEPKKDTHDQLQAPIPHMVVGSQITASLFPDIQLIISLCHSTPHSSSKSSSSASANKSANDHSHVLEHSLHQLLRKVHRGNINPDGPGLSSGIWYLVKFYYS